LPNDKEIKLREEIQASVEAQRILASAEFSDIMKKLEGLYLDTALALPVEDDLGRFRYLEGIKVIKMVSRHLGKIAESGKLSKADLKRLEDGQLN